MPINYPLKYSVSHVLTKIMCIPVALGEPCSRIVQVLWICILKPMWNPQAGGPMWTVKRKRWRRHRKPRWRPRDSSLLRIYWCLSPGTMRRAWHLVMDSLCLLTCALRSPVSPSSPWPSGHRMYSVPMGDKWTWYHGCSYAIFHFLKGNSLNCSFVLFSFYYCTLGRLVVV